KPEKGAIRHSDVHRLLASGVATGSARGFGLPLVETIGRQQASVPAIGHLERRLVGKGLSARIDHPRADRGVLGPPWHEAPAHAYELAVSLGAYADDRHVRHRGDVVTGLQVRRVPEAERQCDGGRLTVQFEAAAHDQSPGVEAPSAMVSPWCSGAVVASTPRAVRATCSVSQYA